MADESLRIEAAEARARIDAGKAIILDVVAPKSWEAMERVVAGAIRISPVEIEQRYQELPPGKEIICYCT
ncbi:MAG: hypothetical protein HYX91_01810 [Chloroflexi bacterium]|nr:hypothetical protein [Chloroflexota bacterium]